MNPTWQKFLLEAGAQIENQRVAHFGHLRQEMAAAKNGTILVDLSYLGLINFSGDDAENFLQGQFSNDVRLLASNRSQYGSYSTPKGRILANFLIWREEEGYFLQMPAELRESIQKRLSMYVLRAKVKIRDAGEDAVRIGVAGPAAEDALRGIWGKVPAADHDVAQGARGALIRLPGARFEAAVKPEEAPDLWRALSETCTPVGSPCWEWLDIRAGIPTITQPTQEQFVPQMVNLEAIGGVSFRKGCYPGQEIVARAQYLGKVKRRMYLANIPGEAAPLPGDELFSADAEGQPSGMIVNAQPSPDGGFDVLAVIQTAGAEAGGTHWKSLDGPALRFLPLPYPI